MGGPGPIPWSAVDRYARRYEMGAADFELLLAMLRELSAEQLDHEKTRPTNASSSSP
ncbi:MAG TPA: hypothetical protein VGO34_14925 [Alphaproteobacteria bacterium]|jgi:hypothetical protein